ncbi:hypothetical protein GCM10009821_25910 [Aeromicrobium halocynthiae]|uniref:MFS transporter n=1 Tax=Aeromicrobium halocynthiae TaxID=560557 RepID=A0ABN2W4X4_9ACTN
MNSSAPPDPVGSLRALYAAQVVGSLGLAAGAAAGPLLSQLVTGSAASGSVATAALVAGSAVSGPAAAAVMRRSGRMTGVVACYVAATLGAALSILSVSWGFAALVVGSVLLGAGTTGVMLGRYAAAEVAGTREASRAIGLAVGAVTFGAVAGPLLLGPLGPVAELLGLPQETSLHLLALVAFPVAAVIGASLRRRTRPVELGPSGRAPGRGWPLAVLATGNLSMVALMGAAPTHLHHHGASLDVVGVVMAIHIGGMFGFSPASAALARRVGHRRLALIAMVGMAVVMVLGLASGTLVVDVLLLVLVAMVWNAHLIAGSMWLIEVTPEALRPRAEGLGELAMGAAGALGSLVIAGVAVALGGLVALCLTLAVLNTAMVALLLLRLRGVEPADAVVVESPVGTTPDHEEAPWETRIR